MSARIKEKLSEIEGFVEELRRILPKSAEAYKRDLKAKAACERYVLHENLSTVS